MLKIRAIHISVSPETQVSWDTKAMKPKTSEVFLPKFIKIGQCSS